MCQFDKALTLAQLLDYCCDSTSTCHGRAWSEFLKRYKMFMYKIVTKSCSEFNVPRLHRQLSESVNDIIGEVFIILCKNEFKALQQYLARENEKKFLSWLAIICTRTTSLTVTRYFKDLFIESAPEDVEIYIKSLSFNPCWTLYEDFVTDLRTSAKKDRGNLERDINIFMLYKWEQFSKPMITSHPCLKNIGHRVIDNVVNRMLDCLRQQHNS